MTPESMDKLFHALAHEARRKMLDLLLAKPGRSLHDLCDYFPMSRIAVMKHLKILEAANLVISQKSGRVRQLYLNAVPIQMIHERWTTAYSSLWASSLTQLKYRIETAASAKNQKTDPVPATKRKRHA